MACTLFAANRCSCLSVTTTSILKYERVKYNRWNDVMGMLSSDMEVWTFLFVHHHQCCYFLGALVKDRLQIAMSSKISGVHLSSSLLTNKWRETWSECAQVSRCFIQVFICTLSQSFLTKLKKAVHACMLVISLELIFLTCGHLL